MTRLLVVLLCCGALAAQEVQDFADDNAFAEVVDVRRVGDVPPGDQFVLSPSGWCVTYEHWGEGATVWRRGEATRIALVQRAVVEAQISDAGDWVALRSQGKGVTLYHVSGKTASTVLEAAASDFVLDEGGAFLCTSLEAGWEWHSLQGGKATAIKAEWPKAMQGLGRSGAAGVVSASVEGGIEYWKLQVDKWMVVASVAASDWALHMTLDPALRFAVIYDFAVEGPTLVWLAGGKAVGKSEPLAIGGHCIVSADALVLCDGDTLALLRLDAEKRSINREASIGVSMRVSSIEYIGDKFELVGPSGCWTWTGRNADVAARIGGDPVRWVAAAAPVSVMTFPRIDWEVSLKAALLDATYIELVITARNFGRAAQARLVADLELQGAVSGPARVYLGAIEPGASVTRRLKLPLSSKAAGQVRVTPRQLDTRHWDVHEFSHLPMIARNADEMDALARKIHDEALRVLSEICGRKIEAGLELLPPEFVGFMAGRDADGNPRVAYMNAWRLSEEAKVAMMLLAQTDDLDDAFRTMEALTWSYLCHEAVHIARAAERAAWGEEYIANMIQPWLLRRVMQNLKAPYAASDIERVFERLATRYRASLSQDIVLPIDQFIARNGTGECFEFNPWEMFLSDKGAYVYFGARINGHSIALDTTLEKLCAKYLKQPAKRED